MRKGLSKLSQIDFDKYISELKDFVKYEFIVPDPSGKSSNEFNKTVNPYDTNYEFTVNRSEKGNLSFSTWSPKGDYLMRLDVTGPKHKNVDTPHLHIHDPNHNFGDVVIPISSKISTGQLGYFEEYAEIFMSLHKINTAKINYKKK